MHIWIKWKVSSYKLKSFNLLYGLGTLMIFSSSGLMAKTVSPKNFMMELNKFDPNIKFTYEFSEESINFLDLNVKFSSGKLQTSLYVKPTDCHQYLHFQSSHPKHTKKSIVYSQTLRVSRACSQEEDYKNYCNQMKSWFLKRSYPEHLIDTEMKKVKFKSREKN